MDTKALALRDLMKADLLGGELGIAQEKAMKVLRKVIVDDDFMAELVHDTVARTGTDSTKALLRLLYCLGVGTIVTGRME